MGKTIGVVAPFIDPIFGRGVDSDFRLRVKGSGREMTLACLRELCANSYDTSRIRELPSYYDTVAAGGYHLCGVLRSMGYDTRLSAVVDEGFVSQMRGSDVFAICVSSTMILGRDSLKAVVDSIRSFAHGVTIIVGGVFVWKSYCWSLIKQQDKQKAGGVDTEYGVDRFVFSCTKCDMDVDYFVVSPDGTPTLQKLLRELEKGTTADVRKVANLAIPNSQGEYLFTQRENEVIDYNSDFTRWDLIDRLPQRVPIRTSIGCGYRCGFCDFWHCYPKPFFRSKESLVSELKMIRSLSRKQKTGLLLHFTDDNVLYMPRRVNDVCGALIESKIGMYWLGFIRASSLNEANIALVCQSGLALAQIGVESGDTGQLRRMRKKQAPTDVRNAVELLDRWGRSAVLYFVVGYPGENEETVAGTVDFLNGISSPQLSSSGYELFPLYVPPLSPIARPDFRKKWKLRGMWENWSHATMNSDQVGGVCFSMFKNIRGFPYYYQDESTLANLRFAPAERKELFGLRHRLTLQLIEGDEWNQIAETFECIGRTMGFDRPVPPVAFRDEIVVPRIAPYKNGFDEKL